MNNDEEKWHLPSVGWSWVAIEIDDSGVGVRGLMLGLKEWVAGGAVIGYARPICFSLRPGA